MVERSRALANIDDNQLTLARNLWLDFDHKGYTVTDQVNGRLNRDWRLDLTRPYVLESAKIDGGNLLVTVLRMAHQASNCAISARSVHHRAPAGRARQRGGHRLVDALRQCARTLHLPPGHRLLGVLGADNAPGSWMDRWGLWNLFGVLIVVVLTYWAAGRLVAVIAALALLLMYQELPELIWLWANVLGAMAIHRAAPEGRLRRFAGYYRCVSFVILGVALLPLLIGQLRLALYPDLAVNESRGGMASLQAYAMKAELAQEPARDRAAVKLDMPMPVQAPAAAAGATGRGHRRRRG